MKTSFKIILFVVVFSLVFFIVRLYGDFINYNNETLLSDIGGVGWLYSSIVMIFAVLAGFVVMLGTERWNNIVDTIKGEVGEIKELWLWSHNFPDDSRKEFENDIKKYLKNIIKGGWTKGEGIGKAEEIDEILNCLHCDIYKIAAEVPSMMTSVFQTFSNIIKFREKRIHYISFQLPKLLWCTLIFNDLLLIILSLFVGVKDIYLDYIFTISIATLGFVIYLLIDDLDNPIRPGGWHITLKDYEELLSNIDSHSSVCKV